MANKMCKNCQSKKDVNRLVVWKWRPINDFFNRELANDAPEYIEDANWMGESARHTLEKYNATTEQRVAVENVKIALGRVILSLFRLLGF